MLGKQEKTQTLIQQQNTIKVNPLLKLSIHIAITILLHSYYFVTVILIAMQKLIMKNVSKNADV